MAAEEIIFEPLVLCYMYEIYDYFTRDVHVENLKCIVYRELPLRSEVEISRSAVSFYSHKFSQIFLLRALQH